MQGVVARSVEEGIYCGRKRGARPGCEAAGRGTEDLLAEKLASSARSGWRARGRAHVPRSKGAEGALYSSGERCWEGMFSQLPTLLWIRRFKGLLSLALKRRQKEKRGNVSLRTHKRQPGALSPYHSTLQSTPSSPPGLAALFHVPS